MNKIVAIGASNSSTSINRQLAKWAADQVEHSEVNLLDLNDYEMPIFSSDRERDQGIPPQARTFKNALKEADGIIISFAEHNGSYSTAFKNIFDWASRIEKPIWLNKPMMLLSTSPGPRGAKGVLSTAQGSFPRQGAQVAGSFSLPSFNQNFNSDSGITEPELRNEFEIQLQNYQLAIQETAPTAS